MGLCLNLQLWYAVLSIFFKVLMLHRGSKPNTTLSGMNRSGGIITALVLVPAVRSIRGFER